MPAYPLQDKDVTLPGWGSWGGTGVKKSKPKKRVIIKAPEVGPRRDGKLNKVIINERYALASKRAPLAPHVCALFAHPLLSPPQ